MVSIVLPVYNGERFLKESIESILKQSYENFELIIVNDCSTDLSESIILSYLTDSRIKYIKNDSNLKLPRSLNVGFSNAVGKYFTWTSDDNILKRDTIKTMVNFMESNCNIQLVYCDYNEIDAKKNILREVRVGEPDRLIYKNIIGPCFMYRSDVYKEIGGYNPNCFLVEDYDYWLRIYHNGIISPLHECLYDYRVHDGSLSTKHEKEIEEAVKKLQYNCLKEYELRGVSKKNIFKLFEVILRKEVDKYTRIKKRCVFFLKHPSYIKYYFSKERYFDE